MKTALIMTLMLFLAGESANAVDWTFEDARVGKLPDGWSTAKTGEGPGSVWKVIDDDSAPKEPHVLAQTSADGPNALFNLCVLDEATSATERWE